MIPNLMVALSLHSMTTTSISLGCQFTGAFEIPAEHPVVYANYACQIFFIIVNYMYQAYEQMNKVLQGHWERMTINMPIQI